MRTGEDVVEIATRGCSLEEVFYVSAKQNAKTLQQTCYYCEISKLANDPDYAWYAEIANDPLSWPDHGNREYTIKNKTLGEEVRFLEVMIHMIREHCLFEVFNGDHYRLDPSRVIRFLGDFRTL